jgi:hypothetical protein
VAGYRARHVPTLSQAAEELEDALANFEGGAHRTLLILDGPLQISRNHGDLIATRPAPLPPSTKPHSSQFRADTGVKGRASIKPVASPPKEKSKISKPKDKKVKTRWSRDEEKRDNASPKKDKSQKSFLMPFRKSQDPAGLQTSVTLTSDASCNLDSASNREDLLLQLPRLQTRIGNPFDHVAQQAQALADIRQPPAQAPVELSVSPTAPDVHLGIRPSNDRVVSKMRQSWAWVSTAQASSVQLPEHVYELDAAPPSPFVVVPPTAPTAPNVQVEFPEDMPIDLILSIMKNIDSLDDLFNFVLVNKRFYSTFKRHELPMIKNALFKMSPPAWELREMSPPWEMEWQLLLDPDSQVPEYTPTLYLQRYAQDIYTLAKLKALVLARCAPFLRRDTVRGLAGVDNTRAEEVDDAFWRVWTFCRIFGSGKNREADITGQMDWLKGGVMARNMFNSASSMSEPFGMNNVLFEPPEGFGRGNLDGLSQRQMYDITEIWTCMSVLLQPLHGKCIEARKVGIFDGLYVPEGDAVREETVLGE